MKKGPLVIKVKKGIILPSYMGIIIGHYKDPYLTTSIMESSKGFFRGSCCVFCCVFSVVL